MCAELNEIERKYRADINAFNDPNGNAVRNKRLDMQEEINRHKRHCLICNLEQPGAKVAQSQWRVR
jgi:hypothetical protein